MNYTTVEQSKKLAEILPLESADMWWAERYAGQVMANGQYIVEEKPVYCPSLTKPSNDNYSQDTVKDIPCWSLSALLNALPFHLIVNNQRYAFGMYKGLNKYGETYMFSYNVFNTDVCLYSTDYYNNPVDACVEMICLLKENNKL